jgi:hypothetical protein
MPDARELLQALVESICLECGLTFDQLAEILAGPGFGAHGRTADWRDFVPPEIIEAWDYLPPEAMIVAFYMAHLQHLGRLIE